MLELLILAAAKIEPLGTVGGWDVYQGRTRCTVIHSTKFGRYFSNITLAFDPKDLGSVEIATADTMTPINPFKKRHTVVFSVDGREESYSVRRADGYFWFSVDRSALTEAVRQQAILKTRYGPNILHSAKGGGSELLALIDRCVERVGKSVPAT